MDILLTASDLSPEEVQAIEMAHEFLVVHQHLQVLGHPFLSESDASMSLRHESDGEPSDGIIGALRILRTAHEYIYLDRHDDYLPAWHSQSAFQILWRKMEATRLRNPDNMRSDFPVFHKDTSSSTYHVLPIALIFSLGWHCAVIILHRHLLTDVSSWAYSNPRQIRGGAPATPNFFSIAPSPFSKEHIRIGLGSTIAVADICYQIMNSEAFLPVSYPPFL